MNAADIMTRNVITVMPDTPVNEIAALLAKHHIGAVPVVKDGQVVGMVTEGDLLHRAGTETETRHSRWAQFFADPSRLATEYAKTHGRKAEHVMTKNVIVAQADTPISDVAELLESHHIKRVPVLLNGQLVGIVSRANLVQAVASLPGPVTTARPDDRRIREAIIAELRRQPWAISMLRYNIVVDAGIVHLWGTIGSEAEHSATIVAVENTAGVKQVVDHLRLTSHIGL